MHRTERVRPLALAALIAAVAVLLALPGTAAAHERRAIAGGQAEAVVGWIVEPAFVDEPNGVDFRVTNPATKEPIAGLEKTIKVEVVHGGATRTFDLRARFGQPGAYTADVVPTSTGDYIFRFTGEVNGATIDEQFESGPGRFDGIKAQAGVQFPVAQPSAAEMQRAVTEARASADAARTLGIAGTVLGLLGLVAAGGAFAMRGRGPATAARR